MAELPRGRPFFVMEYVKGVPITDYCDAAKLGVPERLRLFVQVCHAVQHAHQKGVIHRDLKPSNILVAPYDDKPVPKVIDFGLAKAIHQSLTDRTIHTAHEMVLGTPLYMSPEQAQLNNLDVDTRTDIYSLGVLLYELLTGTTPMEKQRFKEAAWDEIRRIIREEEPPRPSTRLSSTATLPSLAACRQSEPAKLTKLVRGELDWIVMKALDKDRTRRYETANGLARDIHRYLADEVIEARPPTTGYRLRKLIRRNKGAVVATSLVLLALVVGVIGTSWGLLRAQSAREAEAAQRQAAVSAQKKAEALNHFLIDDLLRQADPVNNPAGPKITVRDLLDKATVQLESQTNLKEQPGTEAEIRTVIGHAYEYLSVFDKAEKHYHRAWELLRKLFGDDSRETLTVRNRYVFAVVVPGTNPNAVALAQAALGDCETSLGKNDPITADAAANLSQADVNQERFDEAVALCRRASRVFNETEPDGNKTLEIDNNLGVTLVRAGQAAEGVKVLKSVVSRRSKTSPEYCEFGRNLGNLGGALVADGQFSEAVRILNQAIDASGKSKDTDGTLSAQSLLAYAYECEGQWQSAEKANTAVLAKRRTIPEQAVFIPRTLGALARLNAKQQKWSSAVPYLAELIAIDRQVPERTISELTSNLVAAFSEKVDPMTAAPVLRQCRDVLVKRMWKGDWLAAEVSSRYADCLRQQGRYSEAEPILLAAAKQTGKAVAAPAWGIAAARNRVADLYDALKKPEEAAKWRK